MARERTVDTLEWLIVEAGGEALIAVRTGTTPINRVYALKDAAKAHTELESRATTGAAVIFRRHSGMVR